MAVLKNDWFVYQRMDHLGIQLPVYQCQSDPYRDSMCPDQLYCLLHFSKQGAFQKNQSQADID